MLIEDQHPHNKSITVSVLGAPNVGKSSLINYLIGVDLSVVTSKAQTTRNRFNCITTIDRTEIIFVDTPGLHTSPKEINKRMNNQALEGVFIADLNLILVDLTRAVLPQFTDFKKNSTIKEDFKLGKTYLVFTKSDQIRDLSKLPLEDIFSAGKKVIPELEKYFVVNSFDGDGVHLLTGDICDIAPSAPHRYKPGNLSNMNEKFFVKEYVREQAFLLLKEELPYEVTVVIDKFEDFRDQKTKKKISSEVSATIIVNRPSQRAIVVGTKGSMIKEIGTRARMRIEEMIGGKIHLNLHVKVVPKWFKNNIAKPCSKNIVDSIFTKIMVDAINLFLP